MSAPVRAEQNWQWIKLPERLDLAAVRDDALLVDQVLADGRHCLLEMDNVKFIDSTGVGLLIRLQKKVRATNHQLVLLAPSPAVRRALSLMHLQNFFASAPDFPSAQQLIEARTREQFSAVALPGAPASNPLLWQGEITAANAKEVWRTTEAHISSTQRKELVIDLSAVRFMDSTGLAVMVRAKKVAQRERVDLTFIHLQPAVENVIRLAQLQEFLLGRKDPQKQLAH